MKKLAMSLWSLTGKPSIAIFLSIFALIYTTIMCPMIFLHLMLHNSPNIDSTHDCPVSFDALKMETGKKKIQNKVEELKQRMEIIKDHFYDEKIREKRELSTCCIGPPGIKGFPGKPSRNGYDGEPGEDGSPGRPADGDSRLQCVRECPVGRPGRDGPPGPKGNKGQPGRNGQQGPAAPPSIRGEPGERGEKGFPGIEGARGEPGENGRVYVSDGPPGKDGDKGPRGPPGEKGRRGRDGEDGLPGERGERGWPGLKGERGKRGPVGGYGQQGEKGEPWPCESCPPPRVSPGYYLNSKTANK